MKFKIPMLLLLAGLFSACEKGELDPKEPGLLVPRTVDQDPSLPSITIHGAQLHAEDFGNPDSALLVVLHGGPGSDYRYLLNCKAFADQGFHVVFYDQRGSGLSQRFPKDSYTLQLMFDELDGVIAHYRTSPNQKVFLLGHSWGAMLATAYINSYPEKIDGAILGEPGGFTYQQVVDYVSKEHDFGFFSETLNDAVYLDQFFSGRADEQEILDYKFGLWASTDDAADNPLGNEGPLPFWRGGAVVNTELFELGKQANFDWTGNLSHFDKKVLFLYSERNKAYGLEHAQKLSSAYPEVQLFEVLNAGHDMLSFPAGWQNFFPVGLNYLNSLK